MGGIHKIVSLSTLSSQPPLNSTTYKQGTVLAVNILQGVSFVYTHRDEMAASGIFGNVEVTNPVVDVAFSGYGRLGLAHLLARIMRFVPFKRFGEQPRGRHQLTHTLAI